MRKRNQGNRDRTDRKRQNEEKELVDLKNSQTSILVEIENIANEEKKIFEKIEILKKKLIRKMKPCI